VAAGVVRRDAGTHGIDGGVVLRRLVAAWLLVQAALLANGLAGGRFPWDMFADPPTERRTLVAQARTADGPWEPLPVDTLFRYRRGFTDRTVLDEAKALRPRGRRRERAAFARWAVEELAPDRGYVEVALRLDVERLGPARARSEVDLGTFPVGP
jgi:hypothetical protein